MRKIEKGLVVLLVTFLTACSSTVKYNYSNYKEVLEPTEKIKLHSKLVIKKREINFLVDFEIIDNYIVLVDKKSDKAIKIFSLPYSKPVVSFGNKGQGPAEFIQPIDIILDPKDNEKFWVYDLSLRELKKFDLKDVFRENFYPEKIVRFKEGTPVYLTISPKEEILTTGIFYKGRIWVYNMKGDLVRIIGKIPVKFKSKNLSIQHSQGFLGKLAYDPQKEEIFLATEFGSIVEKYKLKTGKLVATCIGPDEFFPEYDVTRAGSYYVLSFNNKTRIGYIDIKFNQKRKRVVLLFAGQKFFDSKGNPTKGNGHKIFVMNNECRIEKEYLLNRGIRHFFLSEKDLVIYGASFEEVLKFELDR